VKHKIEDLTGSVVVVDGAGRARIVVDRAGRARIKAEARRCAGILRRATPPEACGPEMPVAPGRGPIIAMALRDVVRGEDGRARVVTTGWSGRKPARAADAFDVMEDDNRRAWARAGRKGQPVPLFTVGQVEAGREYAALVERVSASGLRCAGVEARSGGGGAAGVSEAVLADIDHLRHLRRRIGDGPAREMRRYRPGDGRRVIRCLDLVDMVCVGGRSLEAVLKAHGWPANGRERVALRTALCGALDRMRGYDLVQPTR
jgi:hypothetical protein